MQAWLEPYDELDYQRFRMDEFYEDEMENHAKEAIKAIRVNTVNPLHARFYAEALALAYLEEVDDYKVVFDSLGLNKRHVYAVLDMKDRFIHEFDKINGR